MTEVQISTLKGGTIALSNDILTALRSGLHGSLCLPDEAGYDEARTIWNAMIDRRPGAVVRCRVASDVIACRAPCARQRLCSWRCAAAATTSPATRSARAGS